MKELPAKSVLRLECTCVHANKACNGSFKDRLWLFLLHRDFGDAVTPMNNESSRDAYQRLFVEREKERQRSLTRELEFHCRHPILSDPPRHPQPIPPYMPFRPDPDIPEGPFYPQPSNPFYPPENPFPGVPGFGPPRPRNPLDPFSGSELMPSRPRRPGGLPRQLPDGHSPFSGGFGGAGFI
uniref:TRUD domain-containing protein n=1 Tax=Parascaris univalens TaxID=6257 RepID=A0A915B6J0_PARUN